MLKWIRLAIVSITIILSLYFLWSNILFFDDFHPAYEYGIETEVFDEEEDLFPESQTMAPEEVNKEGYHIYVNLDTVTMYVYKNGGLLRTYPVSGGKSTTPTPLGSWKIISKDTWGEGFGGAWLGFNVPWGKYGIHGTVYPWFIGKSNSSKGCIRMLNKDVRELFTLVPHGTRVSIVHENRVFRSIKSGDVGTDVKEVQLHLKKLGYYDGYADGKFGAYTSNSVKKFQADNKLWSSGIVNRKTYDLLREKAQQLEREEEPKG